jgi:hypothetical protein
MHPAMREDAPQVTQIDPVDIQRLLMWYYESAAPDRPHIRRRGWDASSPAVASAAR